MLEYLHINNVGLIQEMSLTFHRGLNIFSGETGAGKSMIIDAVNFVLGERPGKDFIRAGEEQAEVEALMFVGAQEITSVIIEMGLEIASDDRLLLNRSVTVRGRNVCRANGKIITVGMLKEIASLLVDIHGQHQHQSLLYPARHISLLDRFCGDTLAQHKANLAESIGRYKAIQEQIAAAAGAKKDAQMLDFQKKELEAAKLQKGEEKDLWEKRNKLANAQQLTDNAQQALTLLFSGENQITKAISNMREMSLVDASLASVLAQAEGLSFELEDINRWFKTYASSLEYDPETLSRLENRIDIIEMLKHKYMCTSADGLLEHYYKVTEELKLIENSEQLQEELSLQKKHWQAEILRLCKDISAIRKHCAQTIESNVVAVLNDLGMKHVQFEVSIQRKNEFSTNGYDKVEFMLSPNAGETIKPLAAIASGGEMSRVMLALKSVLAHADNIPTFIFDEIDTGVSGRTAQQVAEKLLGLSQTHQLICITHLPQIAAVGDANFLIEKKTANQRTFTHAYPLDEENSIGELSRLIGGAKITEATINAAKEMKQMAKSLKKEM